MNDIIKTLLNNWKEFCEENPDIREAIKDGYEVAAYDEETGMMIAVEMEDGTLKIKIVEDAHIIKSKK